MNRNIVVGIIVGAIILLGAFFIFKGKGPPIDTTLFEKDEVELTALESDIKAFDQDEIILEEINQTFGDILDESGALSAETALDLLSLEKEASEADFSGDLNIFNEEFLRELDQILGELF